MKSKHSSSLTAIILGTFVVLPTAISLWADGPIKNHQERILTLELERSDYLQLAVFHNDRVNVFEILEALSELAPRLGMEASVLADKISKRDFEEEALFEQYKSGRLTSSQYMQEMANRARQKRQHYANRIEQTGNEIASLRNRPPYAFGIKRALPIVQIVGVILVVLINGLNLRQADA